MFGITSRLLLLACLPLLGGCFRKWINTEKEIAAHYSTLDFKPTYKKVKTDSTQVLFSTFGNPAGQPLVFIHGAPGRWDGFWKQLDDSTLHRDYFLIGLDRPGYGESYFKRRGKALSIKRQAEMLHEGLKAFGLTSKPVLVTRSYGAPVGAYMAAAHPDSYERLILMSPAIDPEAEKFFWFSNWGRLPPVKLFLPKRLNTATKEKFAHEKDLASIEWIWDEITIPTDVLYGERDWVITIDNLHYAKERLGDRANYYVLPDAGHRISRSHAGLLKELMTAE